MRRREFLKTAAGIAATAALFGPASATELLEPARALTSRSQYAFVDVSRRLLDSPGGWDQITADLETELALGLDRAMSSGLIPRHDQTRIGPQLSLGPLEIFPERAGVDPQAVRIYATREVKFWKARRI